MPRWRQRRPPDSIHVPRRWRRGWRGLSIAAIVAFAVFAGRSIPRIGSQAPPPPLSGSDWDRYHDRTFRVTRVVDGDTLDIDIPDGSHATTRIRLWGVDTPEVAHSGDPDMYFGPEAKAFAERTLTGRDVYIVLSPTRTRDKFGRLLAYVYLERGGSMFNELLIEDGYAYADTRFRHAFDKTFKNDEKRARVARAGLWADVRPDQMPPWRQRMENRRGAKTP